MFSTPAMIVGSTVLLVIEALSLIALIAGIAEYRLIRRKHLALFSAMEQRADSPKEPKHSVLIWTYIISTLLIMLIAALLYILRPHLL